MDDDLYDGIPVIALPVVEVDVPDPAHLRRSLRYPNAADVEPVAAIEAALDPRGLIARDPKSHTGDAIRTSPTGTLARRHRLPANRRWREAYTADDEEA